MTDLIVVTLDGAPTPRREPQAHTVTGADGKARARIHPSAVNVQRMALWRAAWEEQSGERIEGPVALDLLIEVKRPAHHVLKSGALSVHGRQYPIPPRPDVSNVAKLVEDALKGHAFGDDAQIGELCARKAYSAVARTTVAIRPLSEAAVWLFRRPGA